MFRKTIHSVHMKQFFSPSAERVDPVDLVPGANRTIDLEIARTFVAVCEEKSFRKAADRINRSPSAVSLQIGKLEEMLGSTLFDRNARRVILTEQGEVLLTYARRLLRLSDETLARFRGSPLAGTLRFAAPHDLGFSLVPVLLRHFASGYPGIRVDVRLGNSRTTQKVFADGDADIALFTESATPLVPAQDIYAEELCWLMAREGEVARERPLSLAVADAGCSWRTQALKALDDAGIDYRIAYSSDTSTGQMAAVRAGLAVAPLPRSLIGDEVIEVPPTLGLPRLGMVRLYLAHDGGPLAKAFAERMDMNKLAVT